MLDKTRISAAGEFKILLLDRIVAGVLKNFANFRIRKLQHVNYTSNSTIAVCVVQGHWVLLDAV